MHVTQRQIKIYTLQHSCAGCESDRRIASGCWLHKEVFSGEGGGGGVDYVE